MQALTSVDSIEPRKLNALDKEGLSVAELQTVAHNKRLEILFIATIIPSRRQLACKYGLDEQLIHNILSHREYILQNWKYNSNPERLLTKLELENEMALMELLMEWKRRVLLNGLQMTHTALLRKTTALQKILKPDALEITTSWWQLFNENWEHKQFRENDNDSLEFEDILNDLQWMFTEKAVKRLSARLHRARNGNRARKRKEHDVVCLDDELEEDCNELFDISDVKAEPLYYNDDDFECEDYEFVMDEELVFDSLRRELADVEADKYRRYIGVDIVDENLLAAAETRTDGEDEELITEFELTKSASLEDIATVGEIEIETKTKVKSEGLQEHLNIFESTHETSDANDPLWSTGEPRVPVPVRLEIVQPDSEPSLGDGNNQADKPKQYRRRPRRDLPALTVRKDCVRLPTSTEVVTFGTKMFNDKLEEKIAESQNVTIATAKRLPKSSVQKITPAAATAEPQAGLKQHIRDVKSAVTTATIATTPYRSEGVPITFKNLQLMGNQQITIAIETPITLPQMRLDDDEPEVIESDIETPTQAKLPLELAVPAYSSPLKTEQETLPTLDIMEMPTPSAAKRSKNATNRNIQRFSLQTELSANNTDEEVELILGIPETLEQSHDEASALVPPTENSQPAIGERRKQKFENKLKITSVQIIDAPALRADERATSEEETKLSQVPRKVKDKKALQKASAPKTTTKRIKRRADDSDLTLRRDKVRIW